MAILHAIPPGALSPVLHFCSALNAGSFPLSLFDFIELFFFSNYHVELRRFSVWMSYFGWIRDGPQFSENHWMHTGGGQGLRWWIECLEVSDCYFSIACRSWRWLDHWNTSFNLSGEKDCKAECCWICFDIKRNLLCAFLCFKVSYWAHTLCHSLRSMKDLWCVGQPRMANLWWLSCDSMGKFGELLCALTVVKMHVLSLQTQYFAIWHLWFLFFLLFL